MKKGSKQSEESKKKMTIARLGKPRCGNPDNWKHSIETKYKLRKVLTGRKQSPESISKRVKKLLGSKQKLSPEQRGVKLEVHHINNFADFPELRTSIENGITLSRESHKLFHSIYGKSYNSVEQMKEFLTDKLWLTIINK